MGRPRIEWTDVQLRAIMTAFEGLDRDFPLDNRQFLDGLIGEVRVVTGRLYGATAYGRLLRDVAPQVGVHRRPSAPTIQQAVARAQALAPTGEAGGPSAPLDLALLRQAVAPAIRDALAPLQALLTQIQAPVSDTAPVKSADDSLQLQLTQAALADAHARIRSTDDENARLRRDLGEAQAARDLAGQHVNQMLAELHQAIAASGMGAQALAQAARRLEGTEQFLKGQNDAVRLQATGEADGLRRLVAQLRDQVSQLQIENDQYRRALATHPGRHGNAR